MAYTKTTWADGDVINASGLNNMENGIAANDARSVQNEADISNLNNELTLSLTDDNYGIWVQGTYYATNGSPAASTTNIRNDILVGTGTGVLNIHSNIGYKFAVFGYDANNNFLGIYKTTGVFEKTTSIIAWLTEFSCLEFEGYTFKIVGANDGMTTIQASAGVNFFYDFLTDKTLTHENKSADAKTVGDILTNLRTSVSEYVEPENWFDHDNATIISLQGTSVLASPKIAVNSGDVFYLSYHLSNPNALAATPFFTILYYDANDIALGNAGYWVQGVSIPNGVAKVQFCSAQTTAQYIMVAKNAAATTFVDFTEPYTTAKDMVARNAIEELQDTTIQIKEDFVLTDNFYGVANHEINLYYENGLQYGSLETFVKCDISGILTGTERFKDRLIWKPTASGKTEETVSFYKSNTKEPTFSKTVDFIAAAENAGSGTKKVIVIGDSKVAYGQPTGYMQDLFENDSITLQLVGTRWGNNCTDTDTTNRHEGRAAWGAYQYCLASSYGGLTNPFYNTNEVDAVYHTHFDFSKYMTDQGYSDIDYVIINLGTNDFGNTTYIYRSMISAMIKSIHAYDANIKVIVGLFEGVYVPKLEWATRNASFMEFRKAVIADHSNETNVYLNPQYLSMSLYDDYAYTDVPLSYADEFVNDGKTRKYVADGIHQNPAGFYKNAVSMYSIIKCIEAGLV